MSTLAIEPTERIPLAADLDGVIRVAGTRVTLDTVTAAFQRGATAEEIAQQYPSLSLPDIYSVLGYVLRHQTEVAAYQEEQAAAAAAIRKENEQRFDTEGLRARLRARRNAASTNRK